MSSLTSYDVFFLLKTMMHGSTSGLSPGRGWRHTEHFACVSKVFLLGELLVLYGAVCKLLVFLDADTALRTCLDFVSNDLLIEQKSASIELGPGPAWARQAPDSATGNGSQLF